MISRLQCKKTFSLRAFQNLITRRACQATQHLSREASSYTTHRSCAVKNTPSFSTDVFRDTDDHYIRFSMDVDVVNVDIFLGIDDIRSISAESDCSNDDLRDDEGLIPIFWDDRPTSIQVSNRKREGSFNSTGSWCSKCTSLFSEGFSTTSTPASSVYSGSVVYKTSGSFGRDHGIEDTLRWLLES
jgi:hypothetical protein